jgi:hypothetical protein
MMKLRCHHVQISNASVRVYPRKRWWCDSWCVLQQVEGDTHYDSRKGQLLWTIDLLDDSNRSGALEFVVPACNPEAFLPVTLNFSAQQTLCDLTVLGVTGTRTEAPAKYKLETQLTTDGYEVV